MGTEKSALSPALAFGVERKPGKVVPRPFLEFGQKARERSKKMKSEADKMTKGIHESVAPLEKKASLCEKIAGTLNESDFARFNAAYAEHPALILKSASVVECLHKLTSRPIMSASALRKVAMAKVAKPTLDVVQIRPHGYGYIIKFSAAPNNVAPQEQQVSAQEAQQVAPPEALQTADQQGVATMTGVQAEPDPMEEPPPQPVTGFGLYKVFEQGTGNQMVGYVIPGLFDPRTGQPSPTALYVNGGQYAIQPAIAGVLVGMNFNLPYSENIRGLGIFYKTNGKALMATVPYNILTEVSVEGRKYYSSQTHDTGEEIQITISEGMMKPIATSPTEIVIPSDWHFLALNNPVVLEGGDAGAPMGAPPPEAGPPEAGAPPPEGGAPAGPDTMAGAKQAAMPTMMEIRAWEGGCDLSGPVFEKVGSGHHDWVDGLFWMAAAGIHQNLGIACLEKAASSGQPLRLYGCQPLSPVDDSVKEAEAEAVKDMLETVLPQRHCLITEMAVLSADKTAAALVDTASVDSVLALNFINPENVSTYLENLDLLQDASTKLASLVLATQLGLQSIPKTAATRAMFALEDVIDGLKSLKEYKI